jgi:hypothetical protein
MKHRLRNNNQKIEKERYLALSYCFSRLTALSKLALMLAICS